MSRLFLAASLLVFGGSAFAVPVSFDLTCSMPAADFHTDLNAESLTLNVSSCTGLSLSMYPEKITFVVNAGRDGVEVNQRANRQLDVITKYAYTSQIQSGKIHIRITDGDVRTVGNESFVELPIHANGFDLFAVP